MHTFKSLFSLGKDVDKLSTENVDKLYDISRYREIASPNAARFVDNVENLSTENVENSKNTLALWIVWKTYPQKCGKVGKTPPALWIVWKTYPQKMWKTEKTPKNSL